MFLLFTEVSKSLDSIIDQSLWLAILYKVIIILLILTVMIVIRKMSYTIISRMIIQREDSRISIDPRRITTLQKLLNNMISYTVTFIGTLMILAQLGIELMPILAGAGVIGLAVAFGAQNLVRDVITGLFIILEDQFSVGDYVRIQSYEGTVQEIGLRITKLKSGTGETHIIPNGTIAQVTNFSISNSVSLVDLSLAFKEDIDQASFVIDTRLTEIYREGSIPEIINKPEVLGVQTLGAKEVILRIKAECKPNTQSKVKRDLHKVLIETCKREQIELS